MVGGVVGAMYGDMLGGCVGVNVGGCVIIIKLITIKCMCLRYICNSPLYTNYNIFIPSIWSNNNTTFITWW